MKEICREFSQKLMAEASIMLALSKYVSPIFVIMKDGQSVMFPADFEDNAKKEIGKQAIWTICNRVNADAIFVVAETWMTIKKKGKGPYPRPSEDTDRIERLMVNFTQKDGNSGILYADIHRDKNDDPYLTDTKWIDDDYEMGKNFIEPWSSNDTMQ